MGKGEKVEEGWGNKQKACVVTETRQRGAKRKSRIAQDGMK